MYQIFAKVSGSPPYSNKGKELLVENGVNKSPGLNYMHITPCHLTLFRPQQEVEIEGVDILRSDSL